MSQEPRKGMFEGQSQSRRSIADRVATYGLRVYCTDCGLEHRHFVGRGERLRSLPSPCCGARMHQARWIGWDAWRKATRSARREEIHDPPDVRVVRIEGSNYMRGLDS